MSATNGTSHARTPVEITPDDWLRGYFVRLPEADVKGGSRVATEKYKNVDYLRLRDAGLHLLEPKEGMRILDIGCANGPTMIYCGLQGAHVEGVDLDERHVADANEHVRRFRLSGNATVADASQLPFPDNHFDAAISSDFVEHITDDIKVKVLGEARRVLKPGGRLVTKTPNLRYLQASLMYRRARAVLRGKNPMNYVIPHTPGTFDPQHIGLTHRTAFTRVLIEAGFLNYTYHYAPLRRFGVSPLVELLSTDVPYTRDWLCEDLFCVTYKPIVMSHFPD